MASTPIYPVRQWMLSLFLGSVLYAAYQGTVHFSDWCYLAAATATAALVSALILPLYRMLLSHLYLKGRGWSTLRRLLWLVAGTLALFGLANLLTFPLLTWLGPGGTYPWGAASLLVGVGVNWPLLRLRHAII